MSEEFLTVLPALVQLPHTAEILQHRLGLSRVLLEPELGLLVSLHQIAEDHGLPWVSGAHSGQADQVLVAPVVPASHPE